MDAVMELAWTMDTDQDGVVDADDNCSAVSNPTQMSAPVGGSPFGPLDAAVHPDGSRVYVISNNRLAIVNTASLTVTGTVFLPGYAYDLAVHPDGSRVYVTTVAGGVTVIDTATNTATGFVPVGSNPPAVAVNPAGTRLYVTGYAGAGSSPCSTRATTPSSRRCR